MLRTRPILSFRDSNAINISKAINQKSVFDKKLEVHVRLSKLSTSVLISKISRTTSLSYNYTTISEDYDIIETNADGFLMKL